MNPWTRKYFLSTKIGRLGEAERRLLDQSWRYARRETGSSSWSVSNSTSSRRRIVSFDTLIPRSSITISHHQGNNKRDEEAYRIHGIHVFDKDACLNEARNHDKQDTPLVMLHGYMAGGAYFYRNFAGLSDYFKNIYSLDLLGWGLSSRPNFKVMPNNTLETAEDFFVQSLEAWRRANGVERMILVGHSMGGYVSVAYCEKYPQHVDRLILISPAAVSEEPKPSNNIKRSWHFREQSTKQRIREAYLRLFRKISLGDMVRALPTAKAQELLMMEYIQKRLRTITDRQEQIALARYLASNSALPGSGEYVMAQFLTPGIFGVNPTEHRIPHLRVPRVSFLYGDEDWMDARDGLRVRNHCKKLEQQQSAEMTPLVDVYQVSNAGHHPMLDNWQEFNAGVALCAGIDGENVDFPLPLEICPVRHQASLNSMDVPKIIQHLRNFQVAVSV